MAVGQIAYVSDKDRLAKTMLDSDIRMQTMNTVRFRSLSRPVKGYGKHKGQDVEFEKWQKIAKKSSTIDELSNIPATKPVIKFGTVAPGEYGQKVVRTRFGSDIAEYDVPAQLKKVIQMNVSESLDAVAAVPFRASDVFWTPTGTAAAPTGTFDKDGTVSTASTRNVQAFDFRQIRANMRADNVPLYDGSSYIAVGEPFGMAALFEDPQVGGFIDVHKYDQPEVLLSGEIGRYFGFRFIEETNELSSNLGSQTHDGEFIICGFDPVVEALVQPEEITSESWDHKRFTDLAWYAITGYAKVWTNSTDSEYRIVRIWAT